MKRWGVLLMILLFLGIGLIQQVRLVDLDADEASEIVILTRNHYLFIWDGSHLAKRNLSNLKPWKLAFGDINDDGIDEIAIGVFKTAPMHHVAVRRAFFYALRRGEIIPVFRMSRTYEPLIDFYITDHLITIESDQLHFYSVHYTWSGFGFDINRRDGPFTTVAEAFRGR